VPLYPSGHVVGGFGISGDTACTDPEIAKRVRDEAGMNPAGGRTADDVSYSSVDGPSVFTHPLCPNTFRKRHVHRERGAGHELLTAAPLARPRAKGKTRPPGLPWGPQPLPVGLRPRDSSRSRSM
jgi:hypothetical protein